MNALQQYRVDVPYRGWDTRRHAASSQIARVSSTVVGATVRIPDHGFAGSSLPLHIYEAEIAEANQKHYLAIDQVKREFVFRNAEAVSSFLADHRTVPQGLLEALPELRAHFGNETIFNLEVWCEEQGVRELYVFAIWRRAADEALAATTAFNQAWAERSCALGARVNVSYELA